MKYISALLLLCLVAPGLLVHSLSAQDPASLRPSATNPVGANMEVPPGWVVRMDRPNPDAVMTADKEASDIWFVTMNPGWHIKAKPAAIYYHPANNASGNFEVSSSIFLFDPKGRNEGYGIIFGGRELDAPSQSYIYFLIRDDRNFLVKKRVGTETETLIGWTPTNTINQFSGSDENSTASNTLRVDVTEDLWVFFINDNIVHEMEVSEPLADGLVGVRVNHGLEVHVADLAVEQR